MAQIEILAQLPKLAEVAAAPDSLVLEIQTAKGQPVLKEIWGAAALSTVINSKNQFHSTMTLPAGGWYSVQVQLLADSKILASTAESIHPLNKLGVGEVFITAGQSNAVNAGDPFPYTPEFASTFDPWSNRWSQAHDPMPVGNGTGGSPWPYFGDILAKELKVPVAVIAVGCGGTSLSQWQPDSAPVKACENPHRGNLFSRLAITLKVLQAQGGVRAILWHQGESDTLNKTRKAKYISLFKELRNPFGAIPWLVAHASFFPEVKIGEIPKNCDELKLSQERIKAMMQIREAQQEIWKQGLALPGPDTDLYTGSQYRSNEQYCVHFNVKGLQVHAQGWAQAVRGIWSN